MNPSRIFILRPIATSLLMLAILLAGLIAYRLLPISALPEVDYPTLRITTLYPGASADVVASSITAPLERQLGQIPGLEQMSSDSSGGASTITLQFGLNINLDLTEQTVQAAINAASTLLPTDLPMPPIYNRVNPANTPIMTLAVTSPSLPLYRVHELIDTRLVQKLSQIPGIGQISIAGGQRPAIRIRINPATLAAKNLNFEDIRQTITAANVNQAKGSFDGALTASIIDANDQLTSVAEYNQLIVAYHNGAAVYLKDVADIIDGPENSQLAAWYGQQGKKSQAALILNIQRQPNSNVIETAHRVKSLLAEAQENLPPNIRIDIVADSTRTIQSSLHDLQFELVLSTVLVVMVIYLFLRNFMATLIPAITVPLSLVGTFSVLLFLGFSINNLTLMALTIATGFVVDDAIVVIENISRYIEEGETPLQAAIKGSQQIGFTIISLTISLIAVLLPLFLMRDIVGRLFREFATTLAIAILFSALISLTLTPMMCAKLLHPHTSKKHAEKSAAASTFGLATYRTALRWTLAHQPLTLLVLALTFALTVSLYVSTPKGLLPQQDNGVIQGISEAPQSISFLAMAERQQALTDVLLADPDVDSVSSFIGVDGSNTTLNSGRIQINLKPYPTRKTSIDNVIKRIQKNTASLKDISVYLQAVQDLTLDTQISRAQYQFSLEDLNAHTLATWTPQLFEQLSQRPELTSLNHDSQNNGLQTYIEVNRDIASRLGITTAMIDNALYNAFGQRMISTLFTQSNVYRIILESQHNADQNPTALNTLYIVARNGSDPAKLIPLSSIAKISQRTAPLNIHHISQHPATIFSFNLAPHTALSQAVQAINEEVQALKLPPSLQLRFQGAVQTFNEAVGDNLLLVLASVICIYLVLGVLYESFIHPITILSTLPSATVGALLALKLSGRNLDVIAIIGIILLLGLVKKNAILMIDFALQAQRQHGQSPDDAIYNACLQRFRPILMTTMTAILGALPLMLSQGNGAELRQPLGLTVIGGLLFSQVLTLLTTPVLYLTLDRWANAIKKTCSHHS